MSETLVAAVPAAARHPATSVERRFTRVVRSLDVCGGDACLVRTRIPVWVLQSLRRQGRTDEALLRDYPALDAEDLAQAWEYAAANPAEIAEAIAENERD